ncbi:inactive glucose-1-phosphate adenylyltransferase small subunit 2, chloroplastic-like [Curcuma longa]|uniref:inactive glucose-1-phosphate adenylyltransferase small subunit 2, chloroplastic-like n=1 Tax=Curcuma longa TaxID=136217 RepID=UPI003D9F5913
MKCSVHGGSKGIAAFLRRRAKFVAMVALHLVPLSSLIRRHNSISMQHSELKLQRSSLKQSPVSSDGMDRSSLWQSEKKLLNQSVLAIICDEEPGTKLYPLTKRRSKSALPIAAHYRIIDFVVSNCINSDITKIYALTQFNSTSLNSHMSRAYSDVGLGKDGFVEVLTSYQSTEDLGWFKGNADAVRKWLWRLEEHQVEDVLVLPGHHLYEMDYGRLISAHRDTGAHITMAMAANSRRNYDTSLNFLLQDPVHELKLTPDSIQDQSLVVTTGTPRTYPDLDVKNMGIYVISKDVLFKLLQEELPDAYDFETEVIQGAVSLGMKVHGYMFDGHWDDLMSIEAFYQANMESISKPFSINFHDKQPAVYTLPNYVPPTTISDAVVKSSIIGDGCLLNRCKISHSVIGKGTYIGDGGTIEKSVVMGSDVYQADLQWNTALLQGSDIPVGIGEKTHIQKAIIDKNARIGKNVKIINRDSVQECDREACGYIISGGIVVVMKNAIIPNGSIL